MGQTSFDRPFQILESKPNLVDFSWNKLFVEPCKVGGFDYDSVVEY